MKWYTNLKISTKLISAFLVLSCLLAFVGLYGMNNMSRMNGSLDHMYADNLVPVNAILNAHVDVMEIRKLVRDMYIFQDDSSLQSNKKRYEELTHRVDDRIEVYENAYMSEKNKKAFEPLKGYWEDYRATADRIVGLAVEKQTSELLDLISNELNPRGIVLTGSMDQNSEITISDAQKAKEDGANLFSNSRVVTIVVVAASVVLCILFGYAISQIIARPMKRVVRLVSKVAAGDLREKIEIDSRDEAGQLAKAVDDMVDKLRTVVGQITAASHNVAASSQQISASTEEIASGTTSQAAAAMEINELFKELSSAIHSVAQNTEQAAGLSDRTVEIAQQGSQVIQSSRASMTAVNSQMSRLEDDSQKIGEIIEVIEDIADQTNLLALNAAIEAARAGEQGRGFAVVADEVRKLAERSGEATKQIAGIIKGMQENTRSSVKSVQQSAELSEQTGESFQQIMAMINQAGSKVSEIAAASEEQAAQASNVLSSVESISAASEEAAASSEETAATAQSLARLAEELQQTVEVFKI